MVDTHLEQDRIKAMVTEMNKTSRKFGRIGVHEPEEIAQTALIKVLGSKDWPDTSNRSGWLAVVVRNTAYDALRKLRVENKYRSWEELDNSMRAVMIYAESNNECDEDIRKRPVINRSSSRAG